MKSSSAKTVHFISLGCPKNRVDTERMAARLTGGGLLPVNDPSEADVILINTCGFITPASEESVDTIIESASYKTMGRCKHLVVAGCLVTRHGSDLKKIIPEVDLWVDTREFDHAIQALDALAPVHPKAPGSGPYRGERVLSTPPNYAYLKIAEGCDNQCTFCIIPRLRGPFRSVPADVLVREAEELAERGVRELIVVAQDTTRYGTDLADGPGLAGLLQRLSDIPDLRWIRTLYLYPERISRELVEVVRDRENLLPYFDLPIQHVSKNVLKRMGRYRGSWNPEELVASIRDRIPDAVIRMTVMVGFPGESERDFQELFDFVEKVQPHHLGGFRFYPEDGVPASSFPDQVPGEAAEERLQWIMEVQRDNAMRHNTKLIGTRQTVAVEIFEEGRYKFPEGRTWHHAPEIDGSVFVQGNAAPGDWVTVEITKAMIYDLLGRVVEPNLEGTSPSREPEE
jgi:ribosomal protein S12 methylthiotransferase